MADGSNGQSSGDLVHLVPLLTGADRVGLDGLTEDVVERPSQVQGDPLGVTRCAPQILDRAALAVLMPPE